MVTAETVKVNFEKNNRFFGLRNEEEEIVWETGSDVVMTALFTVVQHSLRCSIAVYQNILIGCYLFEN